MKVGASSAHDRAAAASPGRVIACSEIGISTTRQREMHEDEDDEDADEQRERRRIREDGTTGHGGFMHAGGHGAVDGRWSDSQNSGFPLAFDI